MWGVGVVLDQRIVPWLTGTSAQQKHAFLHQPKLQVSSAKAQACRS